MTFLEKMSLTQTGSQHTQMPQEGIIVISLYCLMTCAALNLAGFCSERGSQMEMQVI